MIEQAVLWISVIFFAMNMGASGIAPSFAAVFGSASIKKRDALALFSLFVVIGAVFLGGNVSLTLGRGMLPQEYLNRDTALVVIIASGLSLFIANILKIPQSTSQVTVGSIVGAGLYFKHLYWKTLVFKILPAWVILPALSFFLTFLVCRKIYPPRESNFRMHEKIFRHEDTLRFASLVVSCYVAFAIGSNNVANAVGPLFGAGIIGVIPGLLAVSPFFGLGALALGKGTLETAGKEIVPVGVFSSTLVSFVTATLLIVASWLGIPQSLVQLNIFSMFAVCCLKNGKKDTFDAHIARKTLVVWAITPIISVVVSYALLFLKAKVF